MQIQQCLYNLYLGLAVETGMFKNCEGHKHTSNNQRAWKHSCIFMSLKWMMERYGKESVRGTVYNQGCQWFPVKVFPFINALTLAHIPFKIFVSPSQQPLWFYVLISKGE